MKVRISLLLAVACALLIPIAYLFAAPDLLEDGEHQTHWEHLALSHDRADLEGDLSKQIIRLGSEGWELVSVMPVSKEGTTQKSIYYFKRPK